MNPSQLNSLTLAYIGDAIYEVYVREYLIEHGGVKPHELHNQAVHYVAAHAQSSVIHHLLEQSMLTEEEVQVVKRGRNAKSKSSPKNMSVIDYRYATAFEALIGFHYLMKHHDRLAELNRLAVTWINQQKQTKSE
jgi:ribonuclease-3 family protein